MCREEWDAGEGTHKINKYFFPCFMMLLLFIPSLVKAQKIRVTWTPCEESTVTQYKVYRSVNNNTSFVAIGTVNHPTDSFDDSNVAYNTHYYYAVTSLDASNNESEKSNYSDVTTPATYNLTISKNPTAGGSVTKNPDKTSYSYGESVTLTATTSSGYSFANWSGDASGASSSVTITMNANKNVTANFSSNQYALNISANPTAGGSVTKNPDKTSYSYGESVTLTASASSGYSFANWSGDASGSNSSVTVTMNGNKSVTANFSANQYVLNITLSPEPAAGTITLNPNKQFYAAGESVVLKAIPNSGYRFKNWSGDATATSRTITVIMSSDKEITANFKRRYQLSGNVKYREAEIPLSNTLLELSGDSTAAMTASESGFYEFSSLEAEGQYITTATRNVGFNDCCILSYDAAIAARIAVNLIPDANMSTRIAADVDQNNAVQMFDASLIAQHAVGLNNPQSHIGNWGFSPATRSYPSLDSSLVQQDFIGIVIGDVDGNWNPDAPLAKANQAKKTYAYLNNVKTNYGEQFVIPLISDGNQEVLSFDAGLKYDAQLFTFKGFNRTEISQNFQIFANDSQPGQLRIGGFGLEAMTEAGIYLELIFEVTGNKVDGGQVELYSYRINAEDEQQATAVVEFDSENHTELPKDFALFNNYPNPFNPETSIKFQLPRQNHVVIKIFNMMGQEVKVLLDEAKFAGSYQILWDGKDKWGNQAPSGQYIYQMTADGFQNSKRMLLLK